MHYKMERTWSGTSWVRPIQHRSTGDYISPLWTPYERPYYFRSGSKSSSFEDSSKSSISLTSLSSLSSSDKEKQQQQQQRQRDERSSLSSSYLQSEQLCGQSFSRQVSQISSTGSALSSASEYPETSRSTSTSESMFEDIDPVALQEIQMRYIGQQQKGCQYFEYTGAARRKSQFESSVTKPYNLKNQSTDTMLKKEKQQKKQRDLIVQDEEEEEYPFAKYTFNKKRKNSSSSKADDTSSHTSSSSCRKSSRDSICSVGMMNQYSHLNNAKKPLSKISSSASFLSSMSSSMADPTASMDDMSSAFDSFSSDWRRKNSLLQSQNSSAGMYNSGKLYPQERLSQPNAFTYSNAYNYPKHTLPVPTPEQILSNLGFTDSQNILPERFLRSWIEKVILTHQEEYMQRLLPAQAAPPPAPSVFYNDHYFVDDNDLPPSVSAQQSGRSTPRWRQSLENIHAHVPPPPRSKIENRKVFRRSHTMSYNSQSTSQDVNSLCSTDDDMHDSVYSKIGPLPLQKENSFDKLKRILQSTDVQYRDRDSKRTVYASSRQQSLPLFLETLSEEEEERKRSRTPSFDKNSGNPHSIKMMTFLEEEELRRASISDEVSQSDSSRSGSFAQDPAISSMLNSVRESLSAMETEASESDSTVSSCGEKCSSRKQSGINIPSIVVSEKDIFNPVGNKILMENSVTERQSVDMPDILPIITDQDSDQSVVYPNSKRPVSPTPDKNSGNFESKDSLEIDEILTANSKKVAQKTESSLSSETNKMENGTKVNPGKRRSSASGRFLSISAEQDEKLLSPTPSTASPIVMSPVTVIEVNKLDNQNDSLDFDELKTADSVDKLKIIENQILSKDVIPEDVIASQLSSRLSSLSQTPKSLSLERRSYEHDPNCESESSSYDTEDVFEDNPASGQSATFVQTESDGLTPLIKLSEMSAIFNCLFSRLPTFGKTNMFYLAQDKGVQCELPAISLQSEGRSNSAGSNEIKRAVIEVKVNDTLAVETESEENTKQYRNSKYNDDNDFSIVEQQVDSKSVPLTNETGMSFCQNTCNQQMTMEKIPNTSEKVSFVSEVSIDPKTCVKPQTKVRSEAFFILKQYSTDENDNNKKDACQTKTNLGIIGDRNCTGGFDDNYVPDKLSELRTENIVPELSRSSHMKLLCGCHQIKNHVSRELPIACSCKSAFDCKQRPRESNVQKRLVQENTFSDMDDSDTLQKTNAKSLVGLDTEEQRDSEEAYKQYTLSNGQVAFSFGTMPLNRSDQEVGSFSVSKCEVDPNNDPTNGSIYDEPAGTQANLNEVFVNHVHLDRFDNSTVIQQNPKRHLSYNDEGDIFEYTPIQKPDVFHSSCKEIQLTVDQAKVPKRCSSHINIVLSSIEGVTTTATDTEIALVEHSFDQVSKNGFEIPMVKVNHIFDCNETTACEPIREDKREMNGYSVSPIQDESVMNTGSKDIKAVVLPHVNCNEIDLDIKASIGGRDYNNTDLISGMNHNASSPHSSIEAKPLLKESADNQRKQLRENDRNTYWRLDKTSTTDSWSSDGSRTIFNSVKEIVLSLSDTSKTMSGKSKSSEEPEVELNEIPKQLPRPNKENSDWENNFQLVSKSLDYDSKKSRKSILQRCHNTVFGKTFDIGADYDEAFIEKEFHVTDDDFPNRCKSRVTEGAFSPVIQVNESIREVDELYANPDITIHNSTNVKERFLNSGIIENENVMYQVGLKYNKDKDCMDVYGRIKMERSSSHSSTEMDEIAREHVFGHNRHTFEDGLSTFEEHFGKTDPKGYFDMFMQVDDGYSGKADGKLRHTNNHDPYFNIPTSERNRSLERTASKSPDNIGRSNCSEDFNRQEYSKILAELDEEIKRIDSYNEKRLKYSETHRCKNCGRCVIIATSNIGAGMIEHDYCRECSPLDLTAEMLERRRLEKMKQEKKY